MSGGLTLGSFLTLVGAGLLFLDTCVGLDCSHSVAIQRGGLCSNQTGNPLVGLLFLSLLPYVSKLTAAGGWIVPS